MAIMYLLRTFAFLFLGRWVRAVSFRDKKVFIFERTRRLALKIKLSQLSDCDMNSTTITGCTFI